MILIANNTTMEFENFFTDIMDPTPSKPSISQETGIVFIYVTVEDYVMGKCYHIEYIFDEKKDADVEEYLALIPFPKNSSTPQLLEEDPNNKTYFYSVNFYPKEQSQNEKNFDDIPLRVLNERSTVVDMRELENSST